MLRLEEYKFNGTSLGSGPLSNNLLGRTYSRYSQSGKFIITLKSYPELASEHYLEIHNYLSNCSFIKTFKNGIKTVRNVKLVYHQSSKEDNPSKEINFEELIFIEDKNGEVEVYSLINRKSLLLNCKVLKGKNIIKVCAIKVNKSILILTVMTNSEIFLFSNFKYSSFETINQANESQYFTENYTEKDDTANFKLKYYKHIVPEFNGELGECCITTLGRFYFSCCNEIFKFEFPQGNKEQNSDFRLRQVFTIDIGEKGENPFNFSVIKLMSHDKLINGEQFELIYIVHQDEKYLGLKNLSLLKIKFYQGIYECNFDLLTTIGCVGKSCRILSFKVFENGQLGIIWESNSQIYFNVFNHFFNGFQKSSLSYSSYSTINDCKKTISNRESYRDLASLLYGDSPLIYIDESEFSSSNQKTNEVLKVHSRIFSESLKARDIEKEEQIIKNLVDSIFLNEYTLIHNKSDCSKTSSKSEKENKSISEDFPLREMDQFIFFGVPLIFSPVLGIKLNDNVTNLPDNWYSCLSFVINTFACDSNGNQNIVRIIYTCWYEGIFNYLNNNLNSILKTPQMHLHVLKKLTLLLPDSKCTKPTSLWIALNSIKTHQDFQSLDRSDINLFFNIIDVYIKNGLERQLINFARNKLTNFSIVLYSWSIHQTGEVLSLLKGVIRKIKSDSYKKFFRLKEQNEYLEILLGLSFISDDLNLLSAFVSSNIKPMKSAISILEFVLGTNINRIKETSEQLSDVRRLIYSLIEWKSIFTLVCTFKSYIESSNFQVEHESFQFPTTGLIKLVIESINEQSIFEQLLPEEVLANSNFTWESLLTLSLLLESFTSSKFPRQNIFDTFYKKRLNLVSKLEIFLTELNPALNSCQIFSQIASNSLTSQDLVEFDRF